jgi:hypothetical protein
MNKRMLFTALLAILSLTAYRLNAQDDRQARTLFGPGQAVDRRDLGFFVAPGLAVTALDGSPALLFHALGGLNVRDRFSLGAFFNHSLNEVIPQSETLDEVYMDFWSVGGFAEYTLFAKDLLHVSFPLYLGFGEVEMDRERGPGDLGEAHFFLVEPSALLEFNLLRSARLNMGVGYRFVGDISYRNFNGSDISGQTGYLGLKIGLFR